MNFVCCLTFILSLILSVGRTVETALKAPEIIMAFFKDLIQPSAMIRMHYEHYKSTVIFTKFSLTACLLFNVVEFIFYVIIFWDMYKHHKRHVRLCLLNKPKIAKEKRRQNTITTVGHFISWLSELVIIGVIQYIMVRKETTVYSFFFIFFRVLLLSVSYVIFPCIQAITSKELRAHVFNMKCCQENDGNATAEEIEMQVVTNGNILNGNVPNGNVPNANVPNVNVPNVNMPNGNVPN